VADHGIYNITTCTATKIKGKKRKKKREKRRRIYYSEIITELLLLSDFFMEGEGPGVLLKEQYEMT